MGLNQALSQGRVMDFLTILVAADADSAEDVGIQTARPRALRRPEASVKIEERVEGGGGPPASFQGGWGAVLSNPLNGLEQEFENGMLPRSSDCWLELVRV